jgi:hypothetical protein
MIIMTDARPFCDIIGRSGITGLFLTDALENA